MAANAHAAFPPPAPGEERSLALALVNTALAPRGEPVDLIASPASLRAWLRLHGIDVPGSWRIDADSVRAIQALRAALRGGFSAQIQGTRPGRADVETINRAAARGARAPRLIWSPSGPLSESTPATDASALELTLGLLAADGIATLMGEGERLSACGAHGCTRLFLSRNGRRWCSRACGDRVRVARHYARAHSEP